MEDASKCVQNQTTDMPVSDAGESAMSLSWDMRQEIPFVTMLKLRLLISSSKLWWRRVVKCPSCSCKLSMVSSAIRRKIAI